VFSNINFLSIDANRLDFCGGNNKSVPAAVASTTLNSAAVGAASPAIEQVGGWRISADMSPEERQRILDIIGISDDSAGAQTERAPAQEELSDESAAVGSGIEKACANALTEHVVQHSIAHVTRQLISYLQVGGWYMSADMSPERRARIMALIGSGQPGTSEDTENSEEDETGATKVDVVRCCFWRGVEYRGLMVWAWF